MRPAATILQIAGPVDEVRAAMGELQEAIETLATASVELDKLADRLLSVAERLATFASEDSWDGLRWVEVSQRSLRLHLTPLDVAEPLRLAFAAGQSWIFTSATLALGDDFSHFTERMGLEQVTAIAFPSPYDLAANGLIYLPPNLPAPSARDFTETMLEEVTSLFAFTTGGIFVLFTSHRALSAARKWFGDRKSVIGKRSLFVQGDGPRDDLLQRFRQSGNGVLLGTGSFWEGVDVRGSALTLVVIDKLPFASPSDPLLMARLEFIRRQGWQRIFRSSAAAGCVGAEGKAPDVFCEIHRISGSSFCAIREFVKKATAGCFWTVCSRCR